MKSTISIVEEMNESRKLTRSHWVTSKKSEVEGKLPGRL